MPIKGRNPAPPAKLRPARPRVSPGGRSRGEQRDQLGGVGVRLIARVVERDVLAIEVKDAEERALLLLDIAHRGAGAREGALLAGADPDLVLVAEVAGLAVSNAHRP